MYSKPRGRKSATTDCAQRVGSSSDLITIVVMTMAVPARAEKGYRSTLPLRVADSDRI